LQLSARGLRLMPSPSLRPRRDLEVGHVDALLELRVVERDLHAQRPEALDALQLPELEALDRAGQIAEALQVLDVRPVLQRLGGLIVDDGHLPRLRHALARPLHHRLVDPLLDDLVPDVVRAVHVEPLLVEAEPDRQGGMLDENQVRGLERNRQKIAQPVGTDRDPAGQHKLGSRRSRYAATRSRTPAPNVPRWSSRPSTSPCRNAMIPTSSLELRERSIRAARLSMRYVSSSRAGMDRNGLADCTTALAGPRRVIGA